MHGVSKQFYKIYHWLNPWGPPVVIGGLPMAAMLGLGGPSMAATLGLVEPILGDH